MRIIGTGTTTYLYVSGLRVKRPLELDKGIVLRPASGVVEHARFVNPQSRGLDHAIATLFFPLVKSQIEVHAVEPKVLAVKAWNAVWDALLIGAVFDRKTMCNLQSDTPVENLTSSSEIRVTNYNLYGLTFLEIKALSKAEERWISTNFSKARGLLADARFQNSVNALSSFRWHIHHIPRLAILWSGIEGLFDVETELVFRISLYVSRFLEPKNRSRRQKLFDHCKELYRARSKAVHGSKIKGNADKIVSESAAILRRLVVKIVETGSVPSTRDLAP
jgi:hypothetical protein